jgi:hypothetical protein
MTLNTRRAVSWRVAAPWAANPLASSCGWKRPSGPGRYDVASKLASRSTGP